MVGTLHRMVIKLDTAAILAALLVGIVVFAPITHAAGKESSTRSAVPATACETYSIADQIVWWNPYSNPPQGLEIQVQEKSGPGCTTYERALVTFWGDIPIECVSSDCSYFKLMHGSSQLTYNQVNYANTYIPSISFAGNWVQLSSSNCGYWAYAHWAEFNLSVQTSQVCG